jgi:hypothetical protein
MHDWSRVAAGVFHAFHTAWIAELQKALNRRLPREYYALAEQRLEDVSPDVLTLHAATPTVTQEPAHDDDVNRGLLTVTASPPRVALTDEVNDEDVLYQVRQRRLVVRHVSGDEPVAAVEIVSPANKHSLRHVHDFVVKSLGFLEKGLHLLMVDPLPPTPAAPQADASFLCCQRDGANVRRAIRCRGSSR